MTSTTNLTRIGDISNYVFGGHAVVTLKSVKTGTHFTYRVDLKKDTTNFYFVSLLTGPKNEGDFTPCGTIRRFTSGRLKGRLKDHWVYRVNAALCHYPRKEIPSQAGFIWFIDQLNKDQENISEQVEVWVAQKCSVCGRRLTTPSSISAGIGPGCREKVAARLQA